MLAQVPILVITLLLTSLSLAEPLVSSPGHWPQPPTKFLIDADQTQPWLNTVHKRDTTVADGDQNVLLPSEGMEAWRNDPLNQFVPGRYNKHPETVPVLRAPKGQCDCPAANCPPQRMTGQSLQACIDTHDLSCWRKNPACDKPKVNKANAKVAEWKFT